MNVELTHVRTHYELVIQYLVVVHAGNFTPPEHAEALETRYELLTLNGATLSEIALIHLKSSPEHEYKRFHKFSLYQIETYQDNNGNLYHSDTVETLDRIEIDKLLRTECKKK